MLHALLDYARRTGLAAEPGFGPQTLHWAINVDPVAGFAGLIRLGADGKGLALPSIPFLAADEIKNQSPAGIGAQALWEDAEKLLLWTDGPPKESVLRRHGCFLRLLEEAGGVLPELAPVLTVLRDPEFRRAAVAQLEAASTPKAKRTDRLCFRCHGALLVEWDPLRTWWRQRYARLRAAAETRQRAGGDMCDLLTGELATPARTHATKIKGLGAVGGRGMGDALISFDKEAFGSYRLEQSANAAMAVESAKLYAEALNALIGEPGRRTSQGRILAGTLVVPWYKEPVPRRNDPILALGGFDDGEDEEDEEGDDEAPALATAYANPDPDVGDRRIGNQQAVKFLESVEKGALTAPPDNRYYVLTLSGAAGRVMVRDWLEGPLDELVKAVTAWFRDLALVAPDGSQRIPPPKFLAVVGGLVRELRDAPAPLIAALWRSAIRNERIPAAAHARALERARVAFIAGNTPRLAGLALLKAYHCRACRPGDTPMTDFLNQDSTSQPYQCGRLLAVLAALQREALGDVGAGVVQRYYVALSQSPSLVLGRLIGNAKNHLGKLDPGLGYRFEERIAEIAARLNADTLPSTLMPHDQSLFALGYYHQLAHQRAEATRRSAEKKARAASSNAETSAGDSRTPR